MSDEPIQRTVSPIDGSVVRRAAARIRSRDRSALARAVAARQRGRPGPVAERAAICTRAGGVVRRARRRARRRAHVADGPPIAHSPFEIRRGFARARAATWRTIAADRARRHRGRAEATDFQRFIRREPLGVVLVLAPWNYPWLTSVNAVVPALLAGNAVMLKMAQQTPLVRRALRRSVHGGRPARRRVSVPAHRPRQVARVIADERVAFVAFTGSVGGGHAVQRAAAERFIGTGLELGGKDPAYVRADADLRRTRSRTSSTARSSTPASRAAASSASTCTATSTTISSTAFVELTASTCSAIRSIRRRPSDPMVRAAAADIRARPGRRRRSPVGAQPLIDRRRFPADRPGTPYMAPQVLIDVDHRMRVMTRGDVRPGRRHHAGAGRRRGHRAHERQPLRPHRVGLDRRTRTRRSRIGDRVETGTWFMNRCDYLDPALAWTGVKDSGRGCTLSRSARIIHAAQVVPPAAEAVNSATRAPLPCHATAHHHRNYYEHRPSRLRRRARPLSAYRRRLSGHVRCAAAPSRTGSAFHSLRRMPRRGARHRPTHAMRMSAPGRAFRYTTSATGSKRSKLSCEIYTRQARRSSGFVSATRCLRRRWAVMSAALSRVGASAFSI